MRYFIIIVTLLTLSWTQAQVVDFNDFRPLTAQGTMPEDFRTFSFEKVEADLEKGTLSDDLSKRDNIRFLKNIHYGIDQILQSGLVLYGDAISEYVSKVGNVITNIDPSLKHLRFYTLRSNVVNAFSTQQGIIFVTEGLVAQVENEAQLAFVIAHEIGHYMKDHVVQGYVERIEVSRTRTAGNEKIKQLSQYSRDKEFEADQVGVDLYHRAGYSEDELYDVFDLLTYSYLPFDLMEVDKAYWNTDLMYIPQMFFTDDFPEISVEKDYDDSKSSHPNIVSRTEELNNVMSKISRWDTTVYRYDPAIFKTVRDIARFETVRNDLINFRYAEVLYSIMLLEREYPESIYLHRSKAKAWAGLINGKVHGTFYDHIINPKKVQGEPHQMHYFLKKLNKKQLATVGLRQIVDIQKKYATDNEINAVFSYTLKLIAKSDIIDLEDYENKTFQEAGGNISSDKRLTTSEDNETDDSDEEEEDNYFTDDKKPLSKYDKIRNKRKGKTTTGEVSDKKFYLYALSDVVQNSVIMNEYNSYKFDAEQDKIKQQDFEAQSKRKQRKQIKNEFEESMMLGLDNVIMIDPQIARLGKRGDYKGEKTESLKVDLQEIVKSYEPASGMQVNKVGMSGYHIDGTEVYNHQAVLMGAIQQMAEYPDHNLFPVDYHLIQEIIARYGTSNVMFSFIEIRRERIVKPHYFFNMFWIGPLAFAPVPFNALKLYSIDFTAIVINIDEFKVKSYGNNEFHGAPNKFTVKALLDNYIRTLALNKSISSTNSY